MEIKTQGTSCARTARERDAGEEAWTDEGEVGGESEATTKSNFRQHLFSSFLAQIRFVPSIWLKPPLQSYTP